MAVCVGLVLHGYCDGYFGRNSTDDKRIEAFGADWIVARPIDGGSPGFADFEDHAQMQEMVEEWVAAESID